MTALPTLTQLTREAEAAAAAHAALLADQSATVALGAKTWTIVNDHWVAVYRDIMRGSGGLYDRPATVPATGAGNVRS